MTDADRGKYNTDLHEFIKGYTERGGFCLLDVIEAIDDLINRHYFNIPMPSRAEIHQQLTEYAAANGEPIKNIYNVLMDVVEQEIYDYKDRGMTEDA